ncbi:MAG: phosphatase PAP2 family protein [Lachnospiraceae bacterium]|nr:phosphatase PAP2 family protein [Lachnospiraceae bacterium]
MKKPVVDYSKLRFSNITSKEYRHLFLILGWVGYLIMYIVTERFIPIEKCHEVHSIVDDIIPFNEYFILAYTSWYLLVAGSLLYFLLYDVQSFVRAQKFIILTQVIGVITYIVWPSVQFLRPETLSNNNFCSQIVGMIYSVDTPTGVCPSLHVGYSLALLSAWLKKDTKKIWKVIVSIWILLICLSVMFVKQHSFTDVWAAAVMCALIEIVLFRKDYFQKGPNAKSLDGKE